LIQHTINQANVRVTHDAMNAEGQSFVLIQFETPVWGPSGAPLLIPGTGEQMIDEAWTFPIPTEIFPQILEMLNRKPSGIILPDKELILP
jgi:hypothetical protein